MNGKAYAMRKKIKKGKTKLKQRISMKQFFVSIHGKSGGLNTGGM
jgi:hypothetical protein